VVGHGQDTRDSSGISAVGVRFMAVINGIGVTCEIIGMVLLLALLKRPGGFSLGRWGCR
jgi:hypothetical protein